MVRQPTIRREYTSVTNAVNPMPDQVGTYVKSTTHSSFGRSAVKLRATRSGGRVTVGSGLVVTNCPLRRTPARCWALQSPITCN